MNKPSAGKAAAVVFAVSVLGALLWSASSRTTTSGTDGSGSESQTVPGSEPQVAFVPAPEEPDVPAATPLSDDLPAEIEKPAGDASYSSDHEFTLPPDTVPNTDPQNTPESLANEFAQYNKSPQEVRPYFLGLVRAGLDQIGLCKPSVPCPATVRFRFSGWQEKWEPVPGSDFGQQQQAAKGLTIVQATFTTRTSWNEIVLSDQDHVQWGYLKTSTGWRSVGVLWQLPMARAVGTPQDHTPPVNEKARVTFFRLLACTYNTETRCTN